MRSDESKSTQMILSDRFTEDCVVLINAQVVRKDFPYLNGFA